MRVPVETPVDPVQLTAELVRCPSVTPAEAGALDLLQGVLVAAGFACTRVPRGGIDNLYARFGTAPPCFAFAGHTDVVPVGEMGDWSVDPFGAERRDGRMIGRGTVDMKSGVAAFVAAAIAVSPRLAGRGSIALIVTGDEEGDATDGTTALLDWMAEQGERPDFCVVGEPTSAELLGDTVKIGRRGSSTGRVTVTGKQGHTAYPDRALNPLPTLARIGARLSSLVLDEGSEHFQPSTLALTTMDVCNPANNVIPHKGRMTFNIRFNDHHTGASLAAMIDAMVAEEAARDGAAASVAWTISGEAFLTPPMNTVGLISQAIAAVTGVEPVLGTGGGTSDARFIRAICPVVEFGLVGQGMHAVDESVEIAQIAELTTIYSAMLERYFDL
ncbi:MAG: succinyl-diaminopimelate desuccinylase [Pseudomonadota bacterium]